jgi:putative ABC transport system permease protein
MKITQAIKMAFSAILSNKMRSFLTMLGIIIGVLSVTLLVGIVQGATDEVTSQIEDIGGSKLMVSILSPRPYYISLEDLEALQNKDGVALIAPTVSGNGVATAEGNSSTTDVIGVTANSQKVDGVKVGSGRFIDDLDNADRLSVAVIGEGVAKDLFGQTDVIGNTFNMLGKSFTVIGVLEPETEGSMTSYDTYVYIPITTAQRLLKQTSIMSFNATASSVEAVDQARATLEAFLDRNVKPFSYEDEDQKGYNVFNMGDILSAFNNVMGTMSALLGGIASISLVVGGIGIMNIMLVSVTERTREIGIRKAIGAKRADILIQFLIEAVAISVLGGLIGLALGGVLMQLLSGIMNLKLGLSLPVSALAIGFSLAIGVIFGIYPANKAAKLRPIDALRYE